MGKSKKVKTIAILVAIVMIVQTILPLSRALAIKIGDINEDGRISVTDLSLLKQYLVSGRDDYVEAMDINSDEKITITDLSRLKLIIVGSLPEPEDPDAPEEPAIEGEIELKIENETTWTNKNVMVRITYPTVPNGYKKQYSVDGERWEEYTRSVEVEQNGVVYARIIDEEGDIEKTASITIENIDKLAPKAFEEQIKQAVTNVIRVIGETEDEEATEGNGKSGVVRYYFSKNGGTNWETNSEMSKTEYVYRNLAEETEYTIKIRAIDGAGNERETEGKKLKTFKKIIDMLIEESQVDRETGKITMEDGSEYEIEIKEDGGYEIVYVGPEAIEDLTEEEQEYQKIQEEKLEEETEKAIINEIIDRLIEEGIIEESQVDRETGRIEKDGKVYVIEIKEDGTYEMVEIGEIETAEPTIGYKITPEGASKIVRIEIIAKGENITKIE